MYQFKQPRYNNKKNYKIQTQKMCRPTNQSFLNVICLFFIVITLITCQNQQATTTQTASSATNVQVNNKNNNGIPAPQVVQPIRVNVQPTPTVTSVPAGQPSTVAPTSQPQVVASNDHPQVTVQPIVVDPIAVPPIVTEGIPVPSVSVQSSTNSVPSTNNQPSSTSSQQASTNPASTPTQTTNTQNPTPSTTNSETTAQAATSTQTETAQPATQANTQPSNINPSQQQASGSYQRNTGVGHQEAQTYRSPESAIPNSQNYDQPNEDRSNRYRAQQERMAQIRRKQQQFQQQQRIYQQRQNQRVSLTQQARTKQITQYHQNMPKTYIPYKNVLFEVGPSISQFYLNPVSDIQIALKMHLYILQDNAYGVTKDVENSLPVKVYVYQDKTRIVGQGQFHFQKCIKFQAKAKSSYVIRYYNEGRSRLVQLYYPDFLQQVHLANLYPESQKNFHVWKTQVMSLKTKEVLQKLRQSSFMDTANAQTLIQSLRKYSLFQIMEMFVVISVAGIQIHLIKKMFKNDSIL